MSYFFFFLTMQMHGIYKGYLFQEKFNFAGEVLQMSSTDTSSLRESTSFRLPVTLCTLVIDKARLSGWYRHC